MMIKEEERRIGELMEIQKVLKEQRQYLKASRILLMDMN